MSASLTRMTRDVLRQLPVSLREIARAARLPHSTLARIVREERNATPALVQKLERLLSRWSREYGRAAARLKSGLRRSR